MQIAQISRILILSSVGSCNSKGLGGYDAYPTLINEADEKKRARSTTTTTTTTTGCNEGCSDADEEGGA
jgi:hypothetical protein